MPFAVAAGPSRLGFLQRVDDHKRAQAPKNVVPIRHNGDNTAYVNAAHTASWVARPSASRPSHRRRGQLGMA